MIEPSIRKLLSSYANSSFPIVTVYLSYEGKKSPDSAQLTSQLHSLIHKCLSAEDRITFTDDIRRIEAYLTQHIMQGKTIIFFSAGDKLWQVAHLEFFLPSAIYVATSPQVRSLNDSLRKYAKYLVIMVDREKAYMFTVGQGEIMRWKEFIDKSVPQKIKSTGRDGVISQTDMNFRHNELLLQRHITTVSTVVRNFMKNDSVHFIIIGGHKEMFQKVITSLPPPLRAKVAGTFVSELNIPAEKMLDASKKVAAQII